MDIGAIIEAVSAKYNLGYSDIDWASRLISMTPEELLKERGDFVDFSGKPGVFIAVIEARETIARGGPA